MKRKKKKSKSINKFIVVIVSIGIFGLTGVSYAYWTDSLKANTYVYLGKIQADFTKVSILPSCSKCITMQELTQNVEKKEGESNIKITDSIIEPGDYNIIGLTISNRSDIPIKVLSNIKVDTNNILVVDFSFNQNFDKEADKQIIDNNKNIVYKSKDESGNKIIYLKIKACGDKIPIGNYSVKIPYIQFNSEKMPDGHYSGWNKELTVNFVKK